MAEMGSLWQRGTRLTFARVVTPEQTFHAYTLADDGAGGVRVEWHGRPYAHLSDVSAEDVMGGWRVEGVREDGVREAWKVARLNCGCGHQGPFPSAADEIPDQPERAVEIA